MKHYLIMIFLMMTSRAVSLGGCLLDHVAVGCNRDKIWGTADDNTLFCDRSQLYRRSDPAQPNQHTWLNRYYPLIGPDYWGEYYSDQPGFEQIWSAADQTHKPAGTQNQDYRLIVECVDISPNFRVEDAYYNVIFDEAGDRLNISVLAMHHAHLFYITTEPGQLHWITFTVRDDFYNPANPGVGHRPAEPFTVVFGSPPIAGDIKVDGSVDTGDLAKLCDYWLCGIDSGEPEALEKIRAIDYFDRADINRDYTVDWLDFAYLANNWLSQGP